jgi:hypothetical protein
MKRWSFVAGAFLILIGVFSILQVGLNVLGIPFRIWWIFWPLALIGVGAWIILGVIRSGDHTPVTREQASIALEGAGEAAVKVHHGAGRLSIRAGAETGQLLSGSFGGGLDASRSNTGGKLTVDMKVRERDPSRYLFTIPWGRGWVPGMLDWDFALNASVPLSLALETGASESRLSLEGLMIRELHLKTGASSTTIELPSAAGFTRMSVESGAAAVKIRVPQGVAASIQVKSALAGIHVDRTRFPQSGGVYRSPDYDGAANRVEILVETGVGAIDIY